MTKSPFPTIDEAFFRAVESCQQLTRELFLEKVRGHIADGSLRATGFLFSIKTRPVHIGHYGADLGVNERFTSSERTEIPPLAMADYRPIFADGENEACQVVRGPRIVYEPHDSYPKAGTVAITCIDGWMDARFHAEDIERLWPADLLQRDAQGKTDQRRRGPPPDKTNSVKAKMRTYDKDALAAMKIEEMMATFDASYGTCRGARTKVVAEK